MQNFGYENLKTMHDALIEKYETNGWKLSLSSTTKEERAELEEEQARVSKALEATSIYIREEENSRNA